MIKRATPLVAALALAGCGADATTSTDSERSSAQDARLRFAQCMREQGVDVPDPDEDGAMLFRAGPGSGPEEGNPERFEEAQEECEQHLEDAGPRELSEEQRQEFQDRALAFTRCMREQGIDMPDPEFGEGGRVTQRIERPPNEQRFREAEEKCQEHRPRPPEAPAP